MRQLPPNERSEKSDPFDATEDYFDLSIYVADAIYEGYAVTQSNMQRSCAANCSPDKVL